MSSQSRRVKPTIKSDEGYVHLGFQKLDDRDFKRILTKMSAPCRERRPRKCRRLSGIGGICSALPRNVFYFNVVGNTRIGDAGMKYLHLLPATIKDLDLSSCGLTPEGIKMVCVFMRKNTSITRLIMWGNRIEEEGSKYVAEMLSVNRTLRILCIMGSKLTLKAFEHLSWGLANNNTLRSIALGNDASIGNEHVLKLCPGIARNQGLETLDLCGATITNRALPPLELALRENFHLKVIRLRQPDKEDDQIISGPGTTWRKICFWLSLNGLGRKAIHRQEDLSTAEWHEILIKCRAAKNINAIYFFLRNRPDLCGSFPASAF